MEKQHSPAFLALVRDAKQRVRETTIPELKKRLDAKEEFTSSTSARITNGLPGASPGRNTFPGESSSATLKKSSRTGRRRFSYIAVVVIAPRWSPTIFKRWVTSAWFPWTVVGGDGPVPVTRWRKKTSNHAHALGTGSFPLHKGAV